MWTAPEPAKSMAPVPTSRLPVLLQTTGTPGPSFMLSLHTLSAREKDMKTIIWYSTRTRRTGAMSLKAPKPQAHTKDSLHVA